MSGGTLRVLLVTVLVLAAFTALLGSAYAQDATPTTTPGATADAAATVAAPAAGATSAAATPGVLPATGGSGVAGNTVTVLLMALGATAGLAGLLLRGLRRPL